MDFLNDRIDAWGADATLDLRGLGQSDALKKLDAALDDSRVLGHKALMVRIDPATPTSGETLFQPVGRALVEAKKQGFISHCNPLVEEDSGGFLVVFQEADA